MAKSLTPKQAIFIREYRVDRNATRAAIAAGVPTASAAVTGSRWLKTPAVIAAIDLADARSLAKLDISAERVLQGLGRIAFHDTGRLYDENGELLPVHELDEETRFAVASVEDETTSGAAYVTTRTRRVKMVDRVRGLELLARYHKLLTDKVEHGGKLTLEQLVTGSWNDGESPQPHS